MLKKETVLSAKGSHMSGLVTISFKIPKEVFEELKLRIPEGERSNFIRDAIVMKLESIPRPKKIDELEERIAVIEGSLSEIKKYLVDLEILTYERGKVNPHTFCVGDLEHKLVDYLLHQNGATTPDLAKTFGVDRWVILRRIKKISNRSKKQLGKPILEFSAGIRDGKMRAWWIAEEFG